MRFHIGAVPKSPDFNPDESWTKLREPNPWVFQLMALPVGVISCLTVVGLWYLLASSIIRNADVPLPAVIILFIATIVVHEFIHALVQPQAGFSSNTVIGFWPSKIIFYAHYDGSLSREQYITIALMPFVLLSLLPILLAKFTLFAFGWMVIVSVLNALLACGDILVAGMVLSQLPANAVLRNQGYDTYWQIQHKNG